MRSNKKHKYTLKIKMLSFFALFFYSSISFALGLGNIDVQSALGQPFYAEIPVFQDNDNLISPEQIYISFRSPSNQPQDLTNNTYANNNLVLRFKSSENSSDVINITSKNRIKEPILQFTIELVWSTGKLYKQFNVLLDPPNLYSGKKTTAITPQKNQQKIISYDVKPAPFDHSPSGVNHGKYGPINFGETLSGITENLSAQLNEDYGALLSAVFFGNPDAFINNNINKLKQGYVLTIPKTVAAARLSPNSSEDFLSLTSDEIKPIQAKENVTRKPFGLKYSFTLSLDRLEEGKSTLLQEEDISEAEIIPKEMIVDGEESVPALKAKIAELENDNTLLEKRLLLLERKVFNQASSANNDRDERLQSIEKEVFSPSTDSSNEEEIIIDDVDDAVKNEKGFNYWLWIPIITAIIFLAFWTYYFYRSSIADNQLRTMLKNRAANLHQNNVVKEPNIPNDRVYEKTIPQSKSYDAYKPAPEKIKAYETDKLEDVEERKDISEDFTEPPNEVFNSADESEDNSFVDSEADTLEDFKPESSEEEHIIDFSPSIDFQSSPALDSEETQQEHIIENNIIESDNFIEHPDSSSNELSIDAPEIDFEDEAEFQKPIAEQSNELSLEEPIENIDEAVEDAEESKRSKSFHEAELHIAFEQFKKAEPLLSALVLNYPEELEYKIKYAHTLLKLDKSVEAKDLVDDLLTKKSRLQEEQINIVEKMSLELFDTPS